MVVANVAAPPLRAATPKPAVAPQHEGEVVFVTAPSRILRQLHFLLDGVPALAFARRLLHLSRGILQKRKLVLGILLAAEPAAGAGVARDEPLPVHRNDLLDRGFRLNRIEVDHAATGHL